MGKPKHRTTSRRTGTRRSHLRLKLARAVNAKSPVKVYTTRRESGRSTLREEPSRSDSKSKTASVKAPAKAKTSAK